MKIGVEGFIGERLRVARQLRGIHRQAHLAELLGVERQSISAWESNVSRPQPHRLEHIAQVLNMPIGFFLKPVPNLAGERPYFRSQRKATEIQRERAEALLMLLHDVTKGVEEFVELPESQISAPKFSSSFRALTSAQIEHAALEVRRQFGFESGTLPNLVRLLENQGVVVARDYLADRELDGLSLRIEQRPFVLVNDSKSAARSRMDVAHELGHLVLHPGLDPLWLRDKPTFELIERQAFHFAGALLLPREEFIAAIHTFRLDELLGIKVKYQVSLALIIRRVSDLGLMPEEEVLRLWKLRSRGRWHTTEPMEESVRLEEPILLRHAVQLIRDQGGTPIQALIESTGIPNEEFLRLTNLSHDDIRPTNVISIADRRSQPRDSI